MDGGAQVSEPGQGQPPHYSAPSPFVTHREMGEVHQTIGELRQGQQSIIATYNHLRGDMLNGFDKIAAMIAAERTESAKRALQQPEQGGLNLSVREAFVACFAIMAGTALITKMAVDPGGAPAIVRSAADLVP